MKHQLHLFYHNVLRYDPLFQIMETVTEGSPWHREKNVLVHTDMVVSSYLIEATAMGLMPVDYKIGFFACAFHDVGKPLAEEHVYKEDRGHYKRYGGHEILSAREWENWAVKNWEILDQQFDFVPFDIYRVGWLIEHHLPYEIKQKVKVDRLIETSKRITQCNGYDNKINLLAAHVLADSKGRICDDRETKLTKVNEWISTHIHPDMEYTPTPYAFSNDDKICTLLIGASGSGKSTYINNHMSTWLVHSMDKLRLEWYGSDYAKAFQLSCDDNTFKTRVQKDFMDGIKSGRNIVVDNINVSAKRRNFYVEEARKKGYKTTAVLFPASPEVLCLRQRSRGDKCVPDDAVLRQYNSLQYPQYGEFNEIVVCPGNLHK